MQFSREKNEKEKTKKRSTLGFLFNPRFGDDIKPLGESIKMFVRLIAMIFASNGLFPKNHPALLGDLNVRLTMAEVIATAYQNVSFTREGMPKALIFCAVTGTLVFSAIFITVAILSLFMGTAHAESMFVPPNEKEDWGLNWLKYIFFGQFTVGQSQNMTELPLGSVPGGCAWQSSLAAALGYYSRGMLVIAGVILLYHLVSMVAETAHSGQAMGKRANQIWAPIRLVLAIGLLVPISTSSTPTQGSCSAAGLNTGQYIVIQMAKWGSGLASNIWNIFVNALGDNSIAETRCQDGSPSCIKVPDSTRTAAIAMVSNYMCMNIYNHYFLTLTSGLSLNPYGLGGAVVTNPSTSVTVGNHYFSGGTYNGISGNGGSATMCGGYVVKSPPANSIYKPVYEEQVRVFGQHLAIFKQYADRNYKLFVPELNGGSIGKINGDDFELMISTFQSDLDRATQNALSGVNTTANNDNETKNRKLMTEGGWLTAGAWFNTISRLQADRTASVREALPSVLAQDVIRRIDRKIIDLTRQGKDAKNILADDEEYRTVQGIKEFNNLIKFDGDSPSTMVADTENVSTTTASLSIIDILKKGNPLTILLNLIDNAFTTFGVWANDRYMAVKFNGNINPFMEVAAFGHNVVSAALNIIGIAMAFYVLALVPMMSGALGLGSLLFTLGGAIFTAGAFIGFLLPITPFIRFFFGALTWLVAVFEAVVAVPMFAVAHVNPVGDGLPGQTSKAGYFFIFHVFLRPVLMVFGLAAGYLMFIVALSFLNTVFAIASASTGTFTTFDSALPKIMYTLLYCALVYICGNHCFKAIGLFPQQAMSWIGGGSHEEKMGDPSITNATLAGAGAWIAGHHLKGLMETPVKMLDAQRNRAASNKQAAASVQLNTEEKERDEAQMNLMAESRDAQIASSGNIIDEVSGEVVPRPGLNSAMAANIPSLTWNRSGIQRDPDETGLRHVDDNSRHLVMYRAEEEANARLMQHRTNTGAPASADEKANIIRQVLRQYGDYMQRNQLEQPQLINDLMRRIR